MVKDTESTLVEYTQKDSLDFPKFKIHLIAKQQQQTQPKCFLKINVMDLYVLLDDVGALNIQ